MLLATVKPNPVNISLSGRPSRACVLVGEYPELDWASAFAGAIAAISRAWGAPANLLVPLRDDLEDCELFWALVSLFDPDTYIQYQPSWDDLEDLAPQAYAEHRAKVEQEVAVTGQAEISLIEEQMHLPLNMSSPLPSALEELLVARTATLHQDGRLVFSGMLTAHEGAPYPLTDAVKLRPLPEAVIEPVVSNAPVEQLLLAAEFGALSPALRRHLKEAGVRVERRDLPHRIELLRWIFGIGGPGWTTSPFELGMQGLAWFRPSRPADETLTVVVGEDPWDFALAYALRRARTLAWWLPESYLPDAGEQAWALKSLLSPATRSGRPLVVTTATDENGADRIAAALSAQPGATSAAIRRASWREALPARPNRLLVRDRVGFAQPFHLQHGQTTPLNTPIPSFAKGTEDMELRWMTEVSVESGWVHARHAALGNLLVPQLYSGTARATADGLAYLGPSMLVQAGVPLELQTVRPRVDPLSLERQLVTLAMEAGWTCWLSEKGQFAISASELFGGFDQLCAALRRPEVARVLVAYLDGAEEAVGLRLSDRRRYLSRADIDDIAQGEQPGELLSELLRSGVLTAGIVLKCSRCRHAAWYRPRDIDPTFECHRCGATYPVDESTRIEHPEPTWRYRLEETLFQFLRHRGDLPALAASARFEHSRLPVGIVPEIQLFDSADEKREIDFVVSEGGDIWIGEGFTAASYGSGGGEMERLRQLAEVAGLFNARGVILATSAQALSVTTRKRASTAMPGPWPVWEEMAGCHLLPRPARLIDEGP